MGRRSFTVGLAIAAACLLVTPAGSGVANSPYNSVTGSGKLMVPYPPGEFTPEQFDVSAHDGPHGPHGTIVFHSPLSADNPARADVTCLVVDGNMAKIGGFFREPFLYNGELISAFGIIIVDNGSPGSGQPDTVHPVVFLERLHPKPPNRPCNIDWPPLAVEQGNYVVSDASP